MAEKTKMIIMGAAGRDFHDFNVVWKNDPTVEVVAFTATQIPDIDGRVYPPELSGPSYPHGIPIKAEEELETLIRAHHVRLVALAYSDLPYNYVMSQAARVHAAGADFILLSPHRTMLKSHKPVIAVCAVRTGCGKSQTARRVTQILKGLGKKVAVCRHPMPYGDLTQQVCQRFGTLEDLTRHQCTLEEREEYEPHIAAGSLVFAGVDYERILRAAEAEADVILWDGGNNDAAFFKPDLYITVADPHRAGHELTYYPGETNLRLADIVVLNKVDTADPKDVATVEANIRAVNPKAIIVRADSPVTVDHPEIIKGKTVLVVEDVPTVTHGEMRYGAGHVAARQNGAAKIVDPRPYAQGSIIGVFQKYKHLTDVLPAMGYGERQMADLQATIARVPCDAVIVGTPVDLARLIEIKQPNTRVRYELAEHDRNVLPNVIKRVVG
ncbi:MAG: cyclic 2,3-diphosphoglycerate synthase [Planctomycetota bacterium]